MNTQPKLALKVMSATAATMVALGAGVVGYQELTTRTQTCVVQSHGSHLSVNGGNDLDYLDTDCGRIDLRAGNRWKDEKGTIPTVDGELRLIHEDFTIGQSYTFVTTGLDFINISGLRYRAVSATAE